MVKCHACITDRDARYALSRQEEDSKEFFFCGVHLHHGLRKIRLDREDILNIREIFV